MEGTVVSDDLAGEKSQADDDQEDCVETGAGDEQTGPENNRVALLSQLAGQNKALQTKCQESGECDCDRKEANKCFAEYFSSFLAHIGQFSQAD